MPRSPINGLRSPHARVGRLVYFGRMLDKIRLEARGALPEAYRANLGPVKPPYFDGRCCRFLGIDYAELRARTLEGGCDEEILAWAHGRGTARTDEECVAWNRFMTKLGWRDDRSEALRERCAEFGLPAGSAQTLFELIDLDEARPAGGTRLWESPALSCLIVMGVSGCGKSTVAGSLAKALGWAYIEADLLHPKANVDKMAAGVPLDDADRAPWLEAVRDAIAATVGAGKRVVCACSALKVRYRSVLAPDPGPCRFVHLTGNFELLRSRMLARQGHFMKESMLRSQFEALETPIEALALDVSLEPPAIVERVRGTFELS